MTLSESLAKLPVAAAEVCRRHEAGEPSVFGRAALKRQLPELLAREVVPAAKPALKPPIYENSPAEARVIHAG